MVMDMWLILLIVFSLIYIIFHAYIHKGLKNNFVKTTDEKKKVSVIIAARNEEKNIAYCIGSLLKQTYPRELYEIIVVDDHSEDKTVEVVRECMKKFSNIRLASSPPLLPSTSPKKAALATGINIADGEILLFTDADCAVPPEWIERIIRCYDEETGSVGSGVLPPEEKRWLTQIETLDALSYQLIGAGAIGMGKPFLANGANFSYRKELFFKIQGYKNIQELGSGDDDLFLQKLYQKAPKKSIFLQDVKTLVTTLPQNSLRAFIRQRLRWCSKIRAYDWPLRLLAFIMFSYYLFLWAGILAALLAVIPWWISLFPLAIKLACDAMLLRLGMKLVKRPFHGFFFLLAEFLHLLYIPIIGLLGLFGRFSWKKRRFKKGILYEY